MSLDVNLRDLATAIGTGEKQIRQWLNGNMADLSTLTTTAKTSLVAAINELDSAIDALSSAEGGATINDGATSGSLVWSSSKTSTEIAGAVAALVDSAPGTLDTLNEIAAALQDDPDVIAALQTGLGQRVAVTSQTFTGPEQSQARANIGAQSATAVGPTDTDYVAIYNTAKA